MNTSDWDSVPPHVRGGWVLDPQALVPQADTRALDFLTAAGFVDVADQFGAGHIVTSDKRSDVVLASPQSPS